MSSDIILIEILRVTESKKHNKTIWKKNGAPIDFKTSITLPGSDTKYRVIGTCNYHGTIKHGAIGLQKFYYRMVGGMKLMI